MLFQTSITVSSAMVIVMIWFGEIDLSTLGKLALRL